MYWIDKIKRRVKRWLGVRIEYRYRDYAIHLPSDHMLPVYQEIHPRYDRMLPHLAKYIGEKNTIIDVGANCGDTLAGMVEFNAKCKYVCIEPDDDFFEDLVSNIKRIKTSVPELDVSVEKALVGKSVAGVALEGVGGTKHAVVGAGIKSAKSLDAILDAISHPQVKLLKTDVDGFDYDVIDSAESLIASQRPLIFFECQYSYEFQKLGYAKTIANLHSVGYVDWIVLDNFGEVILRTESIDILLQMIEYVWRQNKGAATRTINYFDILTAAANDRELIDEVLANW